MSGRAVNKLATFSILCLFLAMGAAAYTGEVEAEEFMLEIVNAARAEQDLPPLTMDPAFTQVARQHSWEMISLGYFSHTSPVPGSETVPQRVANAGLSEVWIGENIGAEYRSQPYDWVNLTLSTFEGLMDSPPHRANILDPDFNRVGIGIVHGTRGDLEGIHVTQVFTSKRIELNPISLVSDGAYYNVKLSGWLLLEGWAGCFIHGSSEDFVPIYPDPEGFFTAVIRLKRETGVYTLKLGIGSEEYGSKDIFNRLNVDTDLPVERALFIDGTH
jgi:hypothetical protein